MPTTRKPSYEELEQEIAAKNAQLEKIAEGTLGYSVVYGLAQGKAILMGRSGVSEAHDSIGCRVGDTVATHPMTGQILRPGLLSIPGKVVLVKKLYDNGNLEVAEKDSEHIVARGHSLGEVEAGHRVALDSSGMIAMTIVGRASDDFVREETSVTWDAIGGLEDEKKEIIEAVEHPHVYPHVYKNYGTRAPKGILFSGPPGCGKTMLGKAAATSLAHTYGKGNKGGFMYVKGPEILSKWVGEAEATIRALFENARKHREKYGYPCVIFLDEAESILGRRGDGVSSDMEKTIVPSFLTEMDGLDETSAMVMLATNRPDRLDPAVTRDGRIDVKVQVPRPSMEQAGNIAALYLRDCPIAKGEPSMMDMAGYVAVELFDENKQVGMYSPRRAGPKGDEEEEVLLPHIVSGAMVENVVRRAKRHAMRRDIDAGGGVKGKPSGLKLDDVYAAVEDTLEEARHVDHADVADEIMTARAGRGRKRSRRAPLVAAAS